MRGCTDAGKTMAQWDQSPGGRENVRTLHYNLYLMCLCIGVSIYVGGIYIGSIYRWSIKVVYIGGIYRWYITIFIVGIYRNVYL